MRFANSGEGKKSLISSRGCDSRVLLFLSLCLATLAPCGATVTVEESGTRFRSRPADFGMKFDSGLQYVANLMLPPRFDSYLCGGKLDLTMDGSGLEEENWPTFLEADMLWSDNGDLDDNSYPFQKEWQVENGRLSSLDNVPLAVLAKRGECTYETKARNAMALKPRARFVIVYDDRPERSLISMGAQSENTEDLKDIGLLFVSNKDGRELLQTIYEQRGKSGDKESIRVLLDGYSEWWPDYAGDPVGWIGFVFMIFMCCTTLSLFFTTGFTRVGEGFVIPQGTGGGARGRQGPRLLTTDEARSLPEVKYRGEGSVTSHKNNDNGRLVVADDDGESDGENATESISRDTVQTEHYADSCCTICLEDYEMEETLVVLPCQHTFHSDCIVPWLTERSPTCPLCKTTFAATSVGGENEENNNEGNVEDSPQTPEIDENSHSQAETEAHPESQGIWSTITRNGLMSMFRRGAGSEGRTDNSGSGLEEPLLQENQISADANSTIHVV